ncbi:hypothetical protein S40285_09700, partial [Stachybotrys chlorohalonatus IBT 40285]
MPAICQDENKLNNKDWAVLGAFANILQSFEDAVKALEGDGIQRKRKQGYFESYGNVWDMIVGYEFLLVELEKAKAMVDQYPEPDHFRVNINLGWKKLDEYYNKLDETPIYYTSLALHPAYRWGYFETIWSGWPTWVSKAQDAEDEYARWQQDVLPTDSDVRDLREHWHAQRFKYPRLSRMAMDFMTVQAMSAECKRLFSAAGRMVTPL